MLRISLSCAGWDMEKIDTLWRVSRNDKAQKHYHRSSLLGATLLLRDSRSPQSSCRHRTQYLVCDRTAWRVGSVGERWEKSGQTQAVKEGLQGEEAVRTRKVGGDAFLSWPLGSPCCQWLPAWFERSVHVHSQILPSGEKIKLICFQGVFRRKCKINKTLYWYDY